MEPKGHCQKGWVGDLPPLPTPIVLTSCTWDAGSVQGLFQDFLPSWNGAPTRGVHSIGLNPLQRAVMGMPSSICVFRVRAGGIPSFYGVDVACSLTRNILRFRGGSSPSSPPSAPWAGTSSLLGALSSAKGSSFSPSALLNKSKS